MVLYNNFITDTGIQNLVDYQYSAVEYSPIEKAMQPFYFKIVEH